MATVEERVWTMGDYIEESPRVARENLARADELTAPLIACCDGGVPTRIRLVASGSSYNACQCALPFMESCLPDVQIRVVTPHRFRALRTCRCGGRARGGGDAERPFDQRAGGA